MLLFLARNVCFGASNLFLRLFLFLRFSPNLNLSLSLFFIYIYLVEGLGVFGAAAFS